MEYGWGLPLILNVHGRWIGELKPKQDWEKDDNKGDEANARALFSTFNEVCLNEFCRIANYARAKET